MLLRGLSCETPRDEVQVPHPPGLRAGMENPDLPP